MSGIWTRRDFLASVAYCGIGTGLLAAGCAGTTRVETSRNLSEWEGQLHPASLHNVRILQFTDMHFFAGKTLHETLNAATVKTMQELVKRTKPDLVVITGDSWPEDRDGHGEEYMRYAIAQYEALGVPWAYAWGNHDQILDFAVGHQAFASARNSLYKGSTTDGNYVIDIMNRHGRPAWQLLFLNGHRDGIAKAQQDWLQSISASLPADVPRFAFFHIPIKQYIDVWEQDRAKGVRLEQVMPEKEDGSSLAILKSLGVRACFCGHDHTNDYDGMCDGVSLVYGRATGAGGYGGEKLPKGGKLITINCPARKYTLETVLPKDKGPRR